MKSIQNKGINLTAEDLKNRIADRKERYTKQQARREKLEQTMENTRNDIEQLEYTLAQMERTAKRSRNAAAQPSCFFPRGGSLTSFARVSVFPPPSTPLGTEQASAPGPSCSAFLVPRFPGHTPRVGERIVVRPQRRWGLRTGRGEGTSDSAPFCRSSLRD